MCTCVHPLLQPNKCPDNIQHSHKVRNLLIKFFHLHHLRIIEPDLSYSWNKDTFSLGDLWCLILLKHKMNDAGGKWRFISPPSLEIMSLLLKMLNKMDRKPSQSSLLYFLSFLLFFLFLFLIKGLGENLRNEL